MPDSTALMDYMLQRMAGVLERLVVKEDVIERNLLSSFGLFYSQRILNKLINTGLKRQEAYEMVQKVAMRCWENRVQFEDEVRNDPEVNKHLDSNDLDEAFDPSYYKRYENVIFDRVFEGK
jgi:adenylosuccinate lyase